MFSTLLKIALFGFLATISAKTGITLFYEVFSPERPGYPTLTQGILAALIGIIFASPFLFILIKSIEWKIKARSKLVKRHIKVKDERLNSPMRTRNFCNVQELKRKK